MRITVNVRDGVDGAFEAAGSANGPSVASGQFFVQFTIQNLDALGILTAVSIDADQPLGPGLCTNTTPIGPAGSATCVVGPFNSSAGNQSLAFTSTVTGHRHDAGGGTFFSPPLSLPRFGSAPTSFVMTFRGGGGEALQLVGVANDLTVDATAAIGATIGVTCETAGNGSGLNLIGYAIATYDASGTRTGSCLVVDRTELTYARDLLGDSSVHYVGS